MLPRLSLANDNNAQLVDTHAATPAPAKRRAARADASSGSNVDWLADAAAALRAPTLLVLVGGRGVLDYRLRHAQSVLRADLTPSHWSRVLLLPGTAPAQGGWHGYGVAIDARSYGITLERDRSGPAVLPVNPRRANAVQRVDAADYVDADRFPNLCALAIEATWADVVQRIENNATREHELTQLTSALWQWLGHAWGVAPDGNPLQRGIGLPDAILAESVIGPLWRDLTPSVPASASCAEAIWQTAKWWHELPAPTATPAARGKRRKADADAYLRGMYRIDHRLVPDALAF